MRVEVGVGRETPEAGSISANDPDLQILQHLASTRWITSRRGVAITLKNDPFAVARPSPIVGQTRVSRELPDFAVSNGDKCEIAVERWPFPAGRTAAVKDGEQNLAAFRRPLRQSR